MSVIGLLAGLGAAYIASGLMRALLFEVSPTDARTYLAAASALLAVALLACWLPARRAAHLDPVDALRRE